MKEGWKYLPFEKSIVKVKKQKSIKSKDYKEEGQYPVVSQESSLISGYFDDASILYQHDTPVVIFGDHTQNVKYVDFDFIVGADGVHILSPIAEITPKFFYYQLKSIKLRNLGYARHYKLLKQESIGYPPLPEQERIVSLLDAEFAKIDAIKANAEKQLKDAKDLFQSKIEDSFSDTSDWDSYNISECFSTINNGANIKQTKGASGLPITRIETLSNGIFNANRLGYADIFDYVKYQKYILNEGDILMSHINSLEFVGRSVVFHNQLPIVIHGMNLLRLVPLSFIDSDFFVYLSKTRKFKNAISEITHKSVNQASFNTTALKAIRITVPSIKIQKKIVDDLDKMQSLCFSLQQNFDTTVTLCNDLKQSILKDIFG